MINLFNGDCLEVMKGFDSDSIDLVATDPPYGYSLMGLNWDKALPSVDIWKQCLRVLKPGAFAFIMSAPRQDVLSRMMISIEDGGFRTDFTSIYWTYSTGFPKAGNIGKMIDKRNGRNFSDELKAYMNAQRKKKKLSLKAINEKLGTALSGGGTASALMGAKTFNELPTLEIYRKLQTILDLDARFDELIERTEAEREVVGKKKSGIANPGEDLRYTIGGAKAVEVDVTVPATEKAKALHGSYGGYQPKPAVEAVIVAMKPLSEKTFVDQALANGKGVTWLDDVRIPFESPEKFEQLKKRAETPRTHANPMDWNSGEHTSKTSMSSEGRFPANLLVSDDVLNDGTISKGQSSKVKRDYEANQKVNMGGGQINTDYGDSGSFSRYFDLDALDDGAKKTFPFLIVPKPGKQEKNAGLHDLPKKGKTFNGQSSEASKDMKGVEEKFSTAPAANSHATVKPKKLMRYLVRLGSRPGDVVMDPFMGSGTTGIAADELGRSFVGIELEAESFQIAKTRIEKDPSNRELF